MLAVCALPLAELLSYSDLEVMPGGEIYPLPTVCYARGWLHVPRSACAQLTPK